MSISGMIRFLTHDLWRIRLVDLSERKSFIFKQLRTTVLAFKGFDEDKCILWASALTFYTLMSIVPLIALAFGVAKGFGLHEHLEAELKAKLAGQQEMFKDVVEYIITFANSMLDQAKGGLIAGIGIVVLVYLIYKLLKNIENAFNDIWGVTHSRPISRQFTDYLSVLFVAPILFILSSSVIVFVKTQIQGVTETIAEKIPFLEHGSPIVIFALNLLPYCVGWLLFTFIYMFMPNTRVKFRSGLLGGVIAGTLYVIVQWIYITFQVGVSRYGAIYGSFAGLPLFMIWIQTSWMVVLFGAEITFAHQNVETYEFETESLAANTELKRKLALRIANICVKNFVKGEKPWNASRISASLEIPIRLTNRLLDDLVMANILSETMGEDDKTPLFQPAKDVNILTINHVTRELDRVGASEKNAADSLEMEKISEAMNEFNRILDGSKANLLLRDI